MAVVNYGEYHATLAGSSQVLVLRQYDDVWYATDWMITGIS